VPVHPSGDVWFSAVPLCAFQPFSPIIYFRSEWISFCSLFCSFWHPTKLIASKGIGLEGLVLFWQFFQEWPSIRWSIVVERDLSLLNSWLAAKKQMLQRYWKFAGYIIVWSEKAMMEDKGLCFIMILLPVYPSKWGDPIGRWLGFDRICIMSIFSHELDYSPQIMSWFSDWNKTKESAQIIWPFPVIENKSEMAMEHLNKKWH